MSTDNSAVDAPRSPPSRWLSNDDIRPAAMSPQSGEVENQEQTSSLKEEAESGLQIHAQADSYPAGDYPMDENLFYSAPSQPLGDTTGTDNQYLQAETSYQEAHAEELLPPPDFKPFFTIIEDPDTGDQHHPSVHYVFSDDDTDILTSAALDCLDAHESAFQEQMDERFVIVDMAADGKSVVSTSSMSPHWQATSSTTTQAPSWGDTVQEKDRSLMLKIIGQQARSSSKKSRQRTRDVDHLVKVFGDRLDRLDEVVGDLHAAGGEQTIERSQ